MTLSASSRSARARRASPAELTVRPFVLPAHVPLTIHHLMNNTIHHLMNYFQEDIVETPVSSTRPRTGPILAVVSLALMTVVSAVSGLNVALPDLARETGATQTEITWIVDAYTVVFAGLLLFAGALGDRFGRRGLLVAGLAVFGVAAGLGMLTSDPHQLIALRAADGHRRGGDHADHPVGDHHLIPRRGPAEGHRRLGRSRGRRRGPGPVRQRHPARVLLVELVLRAERGPGGSGAGGHPARRTQLGRRRPAAARPRRRRCCRWSLSPEPSSPSSRAPSTAGATP